ncbi:unconventional myosin-IXb isoform X2 [Bombina bombina]|uniref:unconventional myosin-IXb isoform X2 n=1 Tax=Bombina bombina TaxID=8345 RepID=UPI00235AD508|nr:unconventional myosin-IXb isoform X2 [Bombina bombina]
MSLKNGADHEQVSYSIYIYPQLSLDSSTCCTILASKESAASEVIRNAVVTLNLDTSKTYVLAEVKESGGEEWVLDPNDSPVQRILLWPRKAQERHPQSDGYYFLLQEKNLDGSIKYVHLPLLSKQEEARRLVERGFLPRPQEDYDDLCNLPNLTEGSILANLKTRFLKHKIYTYAGSILIAINPFKFLPIYNPKYVKMYDNQQLGKLEPHIFAIADVSYHTMLRKRINQCIVISGESGSGKTQSTNFLIHCLTALSQKGYASGVERTILGAGPVLEAFGNAKTAHNNNSSRFGKFIQVNYLESGIVRGAVVEKYLLEKSRLVSQEKNERNYHVFYYLLLGVSDDERKEFQLKQPEDYFYLNQNNFRVEEGEDLRHDFERLKQAMEMVGFLPATKKQIFSVLSAILYLGNVTYKKKASGRDEGLDVGPPEVLDTLSQLLQVQRELLVEALTKRKTVTVNEKLILPYSLNEAVTARDSMAKSLYSALFDWIVLRINHALLNKKDVEESVNCLSIGVLDIFGFEDFENNSFEQFCINYANEQLQYYFNQHIFKLEQEEYKEEGISWHNIDYTDNVGCIQLISKKPTGLFYLLDEESNFPHATYRTLLAKFKQQHEENKYFVGTPVMEPAFIIRHFAGKVKYQIKDFREKNTDFMRPDIVALLRSSDSAYIRELIGMDPVSVFRWSVLRASIRAMAVLNEAGRQRAERTAGVVRKGARVPLAELQRSNAPMEKIYRERHSQLMSSIKGLSWQGDDPAQLLRALTLRTNSRLQLLKSKGIRQKQVIPKNLLDSQSLKLIMSMTLHDRTTKSLLHLHKKKKPPSISAQFQTSLNKLLETLGKAEPFFIRCIRSNAEKMEMTFDEALVLQQLRYTGMLETVRIRRSGYSAKYFYQDFIDQFQVLLPKSSLQPKDAIAVLLQQTGLHPHNYQLGKTKVFLKEPERQKLQDMLHQAVIKKIILLQSLFRMVVEKGNLLRMKIAAVTIQAYWRAYCVRRELAVRKNAAFCILAVWRGYKQRQCYQRQITAIRRLQALCRGHIQRWRYKEMLEVHQKAAEERRKQEALERERLALLEKTRIEEEQRIKDEALQRLAHERRVPDQEVMRQVEGSITNASQDHGVQVENEKVRQKPLEEDGEMVREQERILKENERNKLEKEERESISIEREFKPFCVEKDGREETSVLSVIEPTMPEQTEGLVSRTRSPERAPSSREKRENRRLRGLQHDMLQNKHVHSSFEEAEKEPVGQQDRKSAKQVEGPCPQEEKTDKEKVVTRENSKSGNFELQEKHQDSSLGHSVRPSSLPLNIPATASQPSIPPAGMRDAEVPSVGLIQRYSDHQKLKDIAEKWKEKRQNEAGQVESVKTPEIEEKAVPRQINERSSEKTRSVPSADGSSLIQSLSTTQVPVLETEPSKEVKKNLVQKKKSSDPSSPVDTAHTQSTDSKHTYKNPLHRLLGKKTDKKSSKEVLLTPDGTEQPLHPAKETNVSKRPLDAMYGTVMAGHGSHPPLEEMSSGKIRRNRSIKISKATTVSEKWKSSLYREITNSSELKHLDDFLFTKMNTLHPDKPGVECLLYKAMEMFRGNLKDMYSAPKGQIHAGYKDLMDNFQLLFATLTKEREEKDVKLVLNLFQSFLDEFTRGYTKRDDHEPPKRNKSQKKRRKQDQMLESNGHYFVSYQVNIGGQSCEHCSSSIGSMEKAFLCNTCKMICHKKCVTKVQCPCTPAGWRKNRGGQHFGVHVGDLISETNEVPIVMEKLLEYLEMHGLYTEGIYRKSGAANRMRELKQCLEKDPNAVILDNYPIHAITGILKLWLRELPEPLMTFAQYSEFLRAVELPGNQEQLCAIYKVLGQLPLANYNTLERLIFHLVKVALMENVNRMSPNSLAIVFAPCLLRCPDNYDPLTSMKEVSKTTTCVEMLIKEQMSQYKIKIQEIGMLEAAETRAVCRLSLLQQNTSKSIKSNGNGLPDLVMVPGDQLSGPVSSRESQILFERIQSIKEEKEDITYRLPELDQRGSDEENIDSETSNSTESLLDERPVQTETEATFGSLTEKSTQVLGRANSLLTKPPLFTMSVLPTGAKRRPSSFLARMRVHRRNPVLPTTNIKLPPGLSTVNDSVMEASSVRRREQPGRRTDSIQSVYLPEGTELVSAQTTLEYEPTAKLKRRFSDPHFQIPCSEEANL